MRLGTASKQHMNSDFACDPLVFFSVIFNFSVLTNQVQFGIKLNISLINFSLQIVFHISKNHLK